MAVTERGSDAMRLYLNEIGQHTLLTSDDERRLGKLIKEGQVAVERLTGDQPIEASEKRTLRRAAQEGQAMTRAMADQGRNIRIPTHMMELVNRVQRTERELTAELERDPSPEEVAQRCGLEVEKVLELMQYAFGTVSLDTPLGDDGDGGAWVDIIADEKMEAPNSVAERHALIDLVKAELDGLPERDREILEMRFGITDSQPRTLDEVAAQFGVTRERIRQIEQKTLARMRHPHNSARLRGFLDD